MPFVTTRDGTRIHVTDWGSGPAVVFSHGWPLSAEAWEAQMLFLAQQGFRVVAHDRRGHGRSDQPGFGNRMDTYADDVAEVLQALDLHDAALVGHSTGGGEVTRTIGRHMSPRIGRAVLVGAVPPLMLRTAENPDGVPMAVFDGIRAAVAADRAQFYRDLTESFFGANRPGAQVSQGVRNAFWRMGMQGGLLGQYDCIRAFSETDFTADLQRFDLPTLVIHGDDDQIVPYANAAPKAARLVKGAILKTYAGAPHGLAVTHADALNADLLAFLEEGRPAG